MDSFARRRRSLPLLTCKLQQCVFLARPRTLCVVVVPASLAFRRPEIADHAVRCENIHLDGKGEVRVMDFDSQIVMILKRHWQAAPSFFSLPYPAGVLLRLRPEGLRRGLITT